MNGCVYHGMHAMLAHCMHWLILTDNSSLLSTPFVNGYFCTILGKFKGP